MAEIEESLKALIEQQKVVAIQMDQQNRKLKEQQNLLCQMVERIKARVQEGSSDSDQGRMTRLYSKQQIRQNDEGNCKQFYFNTKVETLQFDGTDARIWIKKCVKHFELCQISDERKVDFASVYMIGKAGLWFNSYAMCRPSIIWEDFVVDLSSKFSDELGSRAYDELSNLNQKGSLKDNGDRSEEQNACMMLKSPLLTGDQILGSVVGGFKPHLKADVKTFNPGSLAETREYVRRQEETVQVKAMFSTNKALLPTPTTKLEILSEAIKCVRPQEEIVHAIKCQEGTAKPLFKSNEALFYYSTTKSVSSVSEVSQYRLTSTKIEEQDQMVKPLNHSNKAVVKVVSSFLEVDRQRFIPAVVWAKYIPAASLGIAKFIPAVRGLRYDCDKAFEREHRCVEKGTQLFLVEVTGDTDSEKELMQPGLDELAGDNIFHSVNAISGNHGSQLLKVTCGLGQKPLHLLIDPGGTHHFFDLSLSKEWGCKLFPVTTKLAIMADGHQIQGDVVLGVKWWSVWGPLKWECSKLGMKSTNRGSKHGLKGMRQQVSVMKYNSLEEVLKEPSELCWLQAAHSGNPRECGSQIVAILVAPPMIQGLLEKWEQCLVYKPLITKTDPKSCKWLLESKVITHSQHFLLSKLVGYASEIHHTPRKQNLAKSVLCRQAGAKLLGLALPIINHSLLGNVKGNWILSLKLQEYIQHLLHVALHTWEQGQLGRKGNLMVRPHEMLKIKLLQWEHSSLVSGYSRREAVLIRLESMCCSKEIQINVSLFVKRSLICRNCKNVDPRLFQPLQITSEVWKGVFKRMDLGVGYHQIRIASQDIYTSYLRKSVLVIVDDIMVYRQTWKLHYNHIREMFNTWRHMMQQLAKSHKSDRKFVVGDFAWLKLKPYKQPSEQQGTNEKLGPNHFSPFQVLRGEFPAAPHTICWFHDIDSRSSPQPEAILSRRSQKRVSKIRVQYWVRWHGIKGKKKKKNNLGVV